MQICSHEMVQLFEQLGLPSEILAIDAFLLNHPLPAGMQLHEAPFWSPSQSQMLREALEDDSDWAEAVDELATLLSEGHQ